MSKISIVTPTFNEEKNIEELFERITKVLMDIKHDWELIIIDNASTDGTINKIKSICRSHKNVKAIINNRNFGHVRSPYYGIMQGQGDAVVYLASDLQDPPELIPQLLECWNEGEEIVLAVKTKTYGSAILDAARRFYYHLLDALSDAPTIKDATGFGIYDRRVIQMVREINDPYPYFRGLVADLGFKVKTIEFEQPIRKSGVSKNNLSTLFDVAMLGITSHSRIPLRLSSLLGFLVGFVSLIVGLVFIALKLTFWDSFPIGIAPIIILFCFLFAAVFFILGIIGEYLGIIHLKLQNRPVVVPREKINFDD